MPYTPYSIEEPFLCQGSFRAIALAAAERCGKGIHQGGYTPAAKKLPGPIRLNLGVSFATQLQNASLGVAFHRVCFLDRANEWLPRNRGSPPRVQPFVALDLIARARKQSGRSLGDSANHVPISALKAIFCGGFFEDVLY